MISIVGFIGMGMGKTTLARWTYNDEMVTGHFDFKFWVDMSRELNISKLAKEILNHVEQVMACKRNP